MDGIAANRAVVHDFLQVLETDLIETHPKKGGHVFYHSTSEKGAIRLASMSQINIGIKGKWLLRLRPQRSDHGTLLHAAVSTILTKNGQEFEGKFVYRHFQTVCQASISLL